MRMVSDFEEFYKLYAEGKIKPDVHSLYGRRSVDLLRSKGWKIGKWRTARDLLAICRKSPENFELAFREAGIDFHVG